jgi:hypothetical protein
MSTKFNSDAIKKAAGELGLILHDMSAFSALKISVPNAGNFEVAKWLEQIVQDRTNGIVAHAEHLQVALTNMETKLNWIASEFENADGENAAKIKASIAGLQADIKGDISSFDQNSGPRPTPSDGSPPTEKTPPVTDEKPPAEEKPPPEEKKEKKDKPLSDTAIARS